MLGERLTVAGNRHSVELLIAKVEKMRRAGSFVALCGVLFLAGQSAQALPILATWTGSSGSWSTSTDWSFDRTVPGGSIPDNTDTDTFDVQVDGGGVADSIVLLDANVTIASLDISVNDRVEIASGARLGLGGVSGTSQSGTINNRGVIQLMDGLLSGARIESNTDILLSGTGVLELGTLGNNVVGYTEQFVNGPGHTIRGAGRIENLNPQIREIMNEGTIEQTGANALTLDRARNEGLIRATGAGGLVLLDRLINTGLVEIGPGSRLDATQATTQYVDFSNAGQLRIIGPGTTADFGTFGNSGDFQVLDGAVARISRIRDSQFNAARMLIRSAQLELPNQHTTSGKIVLDNGTLLFDDELTMLGTARLEGSGSIVVRGSSVRADGLVIDGTLAPGLNGAGRIDVDGDVNMSMGAIEVDLLGTTPALFDRLTAAGDVTLGDRGRIIVTDPTVYAPDVGNRFDLIVANQITSSTVGLQKRVLAPALDSPDKYFIAQILGGSGTQTLALGVAEAITANWTGGIGAYDDASGWSFSSPPINATVANNDLASIFDVVIDDAPGAIATAANDLRIASLAVAAGNTLALANDRTVLLEEFVNRPENGQVRVDGVLRLGANGKILADGDLQLTGRGIIELGEGNGNKIENANTGVSDVAIGTDLTVTGAGSIVQLPGPVITGSGEVDNQGTIEATGVNALVIGRGINAGTLRATGSGGLEIGRFENNGQIEVMPGSSLTTRSFERLTNLGHIQIQGANTTAHISVANQGTIEVSEGAVAHFPTFSNSGDLTVRSAQMSANVGSEFFGSRVILDQGIVDLILSGPTIEFDRTRLEGSGRLSLQQFAGTPGTLTLRESGAISPGASAQAGLLEIDGSLDLTPYVTVPSMEFDVFASSSGQYDALHVTGDVQFGTRGLPAIRFDSAYTPTAGDTFDVLEAANILGYADSLLGPSNLPILDGLGLYFNSRLTDGAAKDALSFALEAPIQANWIGGVGSFGGDGNWMFSDPPVGTMIPDGTGGQVFDAVISGGGTPSIVGLNQAVTLRRLALDAGNRLTIGSQGILRLETPLGNSRPGGIRSDGLVRVDGGRIESDISFRLDGTGSLEFDGSTGTTLEIESRFPFGNSLEIGQDFTLRGAGDVIATGGVLNEGLIETGTSGNLFFEVPSGTFGSPPQFDNQGQIRTRTGGQFEVQGLLDSSGSIVVESDSNMVFTSVRFFLGALINRGTATVAGSVTAPSVLNLGDLDIEGGTFSSSVFENQGRVAVGSGSIDSSNFDNLASLVVESGAMIQATQSFRHSDDAATTRLQGTLDLGSSGRMVLTDGRFTLDGGTVQGPGSSPIGLILGTDATIDGSGTIDIQSRRDSSLSGILSPGESGTGTIAFTDGVSFNTSSVLAIDVGLSGGQKSHDLVTAIGTSVLSGTVMLNVLSGDAVQLGDFFDVLVSTTITDGGFTLIASDLAGGLSWAASIVSGMNDASLRVQVVPEPGTVVLLALGLLGLARRRP